MSSIPACRQAGMTTGMTTERGDPAKPAIHSPLGLPLLDSSFRWNDGGEMSSFMDRKSCMRREDRTSEAAMDRMSCMRREGRTSEAAMDRMSCMRREDRMSEAAMDRKSGMRREDRMSEAAMDRKSGMRREGTPAWMHAYRDVRLQGCRG